jgi:Glycosyltransferase
MIELYPENEYELFFNGQYDIGKQPFVTSTNTHIHTIRYLHGNDLNPFNRCIHLATYGLKPLNLLHILSPFEPQTHTVITRKPFSRTVVTIYDFIPLIFKELYLPSPIHLKLYYDRLKILRSANLLVSISEATRRDAIELLSLAPEKIVNVGIAPSSDFRKLEPSVAVAISQIREKHGIQGPFVMTVSNLDHRKNLVTLLRAFTSLPDFILREFMLIVVCNSDPKYVERDSDVSDLLDHSPARIKFLYFIPVDELVALYNSCHLFVYASLYEGGGLPVVEAMKCGAPVLASNTSSIPEYLGRPDALFDPRDQVNIADSMFRVLTNEELRRELGRYGEEHAKNFSWDGVVERTMKAYEQVAG